MNLTREKALQIVLQYLTAEMHCSIHIQDGIPTGCTFYGIDQVKSEPCWMASIPPESSMVGQGRIICISKKTCRIIYDGYTNGE
jgi:hypothetical protein